MAITHLDAVRNTFCTTVSTATDFGPAAGNCVLLTGATTVSTIILNDPSFDAPSAGVMALPWVMALDVTTVPEDAGAVGNAAAVDSMEFRDSTGTVVFTGGFITGVGGGGDLELSKNPIDSNDIVQLTSFSYTASP